MKIGVFGDSFAEKKFPIWWKYLEDEYHHKVDCFGEGSSSILYSAKLINEKAIDYDIAIWCVSSIGRLSIQHSNGLAHLPGSVQRITQYAELYHAYQTYVTYLFNEGDDTFVCNAMIKSIVNEHQNIMLIPCFPDPLFSNCETKGFNLFELSSKEARYFFPYMSLNDVWVKYKDLRAGHLTDTNQRILAKCINDNLSPGIFQAEYINFSVPTVPLTQCFAL